MFRLPPLLPRSPRLWSRWILLAVMTLWLSGSVAAQPENAPPARFQRAVVIQMKGEIHPLLEHYVYRKLNEAGRLRADLVILEIDSPGGYLHSSLNIAKRLRDLEGVHTVAYVPREAYSGAAIAALGCDEILMHPTAQFGDAGPIFAKDAQFHHAPEKIRSVLVSELRQLAEAKGRSPALAQAMVDLDITVFRVTHQDGRVAFMSEKELKSEPDPSVWTKGPPVLETQGKLFLTVTGKRAVELDLAAAEINNRDELQKHFGLTGPLTILEAGAVDTTVYILNLPIVTGLLFVAGLIALYFELSAPGLSVGGLISGLCFALFFWSRFLGGTSGWLELLLFAAGLVFLAVELFVLPGFGVAGVLGLILIGVSLIMASQDFVFPTTPRQVNTISHSVLTLAGATVVFLVAAYFVTKHYQSVPILNRLVLQPPAPEDVAVDPEKAKAEGKPLTPAVGEVNVGDWGVAESPLRPAGKAIFGDQYLDVVTDGSFVDKGQQVRILKVHGNRIVVREILPPASGQV